MAFYYNPYNIDDSKFAIPFGPVDKVTVLPNGSIIREVFAKNVTPESIAHVKKVAADLYIQQLIEDAAEKEGSQPQASG